MSDNGQPASVEEVWAQPITLDEARAAAQARHDEAEARRRANANAAEKRRIQQAVEDRTMLVTELGITEEVAIATTNNPKLTPQQRQRLHREARSVFAKGLKPEELPADMPDDPYGGKLDAANRRIEGLVGELSDERERAGGLETERDDLRGQIRETEETLAELKKLIGLPDESTESELTDKIKSLVEDDGKPEPPPAEREAQDDTTDTINKEDTTTPESGHESAKPTQGRRTVDVPPPGEGKPASEPAPPKSGRTGTHVPPARRGKRGEETDK